MQSENTITSYRDKLKETGFLEIHLSDLYPNLFKELKDIVTEDLLINRLNSIRVDSLIPDKYDSDSINYIVENTTKLLKNDFIEFNIREQDGEDWNKLEFNPSFDSISLSDLTVLKNKIIDISNSVAQSWIEGPLEHQSSPHIWMHNFLNKILIDFYDSPNYLETESNPFRITCFQKGDKIVSHKDSDGANFKCVVLLYLSNNYQEGYGGELNLMGHHKIKPEFGNLVILDFTNNNIEHEVIEIQEDYYRLAITTFISNE